MQKQKTDEITAWDYRSAFGPSGRIQTNKFLHLDWKKVKSSQKYLDKNVFN